MFHYAPLSGPSYHLFTILFPCKHQCSQPYLSVGGKWKHLPEFAPSFPFFCSSQFLSIFPNFFLIWVDSLLFPQIFLPFFPLENSAPPPSCPPCPCAGYTTGKRKVLFILSLCLFCPEYPVQAYSFPNYFSTLYRKTKPKGSRAAACLFVNYLSDDIPNVLLKSATKEKIPLSNCPNVTNK